MNVYCGPGRVLLLDEENQPVDFTATDVNLADDLGLKRYVVVNYG